MYIGVPGLASAHFFVFSGRGRSLWNLRFVAFCTYSEIFRWNIWL